MAAVRESVIFMLEACVQLHEEAFEQDPESRKEKKSRAEPWEAPRHRQNAAADVSGAEIGA